MIEKTNKRTKDGKNLKRVFDVDAKKVNTEKYITFLARRISLDTFGEVQVHWSSLSIGIRPAVQLHWLCFLCCFFTRRMANKGCFLLHNDECVDHRLWRCVLRMLCFYENLLWIIFFPCFCERMSKGGVLESRTLIVLCFSDVFRFFRTVQNSAPHFLLINIWLSNLFW